MDKTIPNKPGVYLFKDAQNIILYVGKATCLRSRVRSYFQRQGKDRKIDSLIAEHATVEHIVTGAETEVSLLEAHLIKMYQPRHQSYSYRPSLKSNWWFTTSKAIIKLTLYLYLLRKTLVGEWPFCHFLKLGCVANISLTPELISGDFKGIISFIGTHLTSTVR